MSTADELEKLNRLHKEGVLNDEEYEKAKKTALENQKSVATKIDEAVSDAIQDVPKYCMFLHLSQILGYILLGVGFTAPIIMWALRKDDSRDIHLHGLNIMNWMLSAFIYGVISTILGKALIGIPLLGAVVVCTIAFPVIGALKARDGIIWKYPFTIPFFKPERP